MVIVRIAGGLGNQMFQYAFGRALAVAKDTELRLDLGAYSNYPLHNGFELDRVFAVTAPEATQNDFRMVLGWRARPSLRHLLRRRRLAWLRNAHYLVEPHFQYWKTAPSAPSDCYLVGYWQSERYFVAVHDLIRREFVFCPPLSERNRALYEEILSAESIGVHVRRGDYASDQQTARIHGSCSLDYYQRALDYVAERCAAPRLFVFSDEPNWVKSRLQTDLPTHYVGHNRGADSFNDMRLMSACRHHVIANSSFSWWAAWLNPSSDKIVVAPRRWFAIERDCSDLIPARWTRL